MDYTVDQVTVGITVRGALKEMTLFLASCIPDDYSVNWFAADDEVIPPGRVEVHTRDHGSFSGDALPSMCPCIITYITVDM